MDTQRARKQIEHAAEVQRRRLELVEVLRDGWAELAPVFRFGEDGRNATAVGELIHDSEDALRSAVAFAVRGDLDHAAGMVDESCRNLAVVALARDSEALPVALRRELARLAEVPAKLRRAFLEGEQALCRFEDAFEEEEERPGVQDPLAALVAAFEPAGPRLRLVQ